MKKKHKGIMGASHIPYAQRLKIQQQDRIAVNRNHSCPRFEDYDPKKG